jgi:hypothetical protein
MVGCSLIRRTDELQVTFGGSGSLKQGTGRDSVYSTMEVSNLTLGGHGVYLVSQANTVLQT